MISRDQNSSEQERREKVDNDQEAANSDLLMAG